MGFGWHRWGRSFRPADNGTVYDYYIRLRSKTGTKPAPGVVEAFLKEALPPRETLTGESERELALDDAPEARRRRPRLLAMIHLSGRTISCLAWKRCIRKMSIP